MLTRLPPIDWTDRWLGGFCALGAIGGLPVRGPDYAAHPPLDQALTLVAPPDLPPADLATAQAAWSAALGGAPVLLVRNVELARALLLTAAGVAPGEPVGLPANATRALTEAVKRHGARPRFLGLDASLALCNGPAALDGARAVWAQPVGGLPAPEALPGAALWVDCADTLPLPGPLAPAASALLWGLHLSPHAAEAGALLAFADADLAAAAQARLLPADTPDPALALAQLARLAGAAGLAERQQAALAEVWRGLHQAAGLPLLPLPEAGALAQHVAVRIPDECDVATFYAYVRGEHTPVRWLPEARPLHYAALRRNGAPDPAAAAAHLARWLLVPVGPDYTSEEISHAILGIAKASDYLGVRWYANPERAAWYGALMEEWYGPDHDAYRPLFLREVIG